MSDTARTARRRDASGSGWLRRYPPLATFVAALVIMLLIMPSALNLPQANPSTVLEYAPIPPDDENPPPQSEGSLSALGLGTSDTLQRDAASEQNPFDLDAPDPTQRAGGERPITKRCVDIPGDGRGPIQTEDPNSPPCVPHFEGDNGGATYQGVTGDEITVLVFTEGGLIYHAPETDQGTETTPPSGSYCDVDRPYDADAEQERGCMNGEGTGPFFLVEIVQAYSRYFNARFQTYGRHVHFWIYWSGAGTAAQRRSDAQDNWERLKPFAVIDYAHFRGNNGAYADAMAKRNVTVYSSFALLPNQIYRDNAPFLWSFWPDVERSAGLYADYVCSRIAPFPVSWSGNSEDQGKPRKYGLLYTSDRNYDHLRKYAAEVKRQFERGCPNGARLDIAGEWTYPRNGWSWDTHPDQISAARTNIADMQTKEVTTILWLSGYETRHSEAADESGWYPEWVVAGDLTNDEIEESQRGGANSPGSQNQNAWQYAHILTPQLRQDRSAETPCRQAYREADPGGSEEQEIYACGVYRGFFMLFRGIQVAGPYLTPEAVDQGNHAIPRQESNNPYVAACFFEPGDYSCVKDAHEAYWDPSAPDPDGDPNQNGCWRMINEGIRHIEGQWPQANPFNERTPQDPCNNAGNNSAALNPYGPAG